MAVKIRCADCKYASVDRRACEYAKKSCKECDANAGCTCNQRNCKCGKCCKLRNTDIICPKQELLWAAYQCENPHSEYYCCLLNVTVNGDRQSRITWSGCIEGVRE